MKRNVLHAMAKIFGSIACAVRLLVNLSPTVREVRDLPSNIYIDGNKGWEQLTAIGGAFTLADETGSEVGSNLSEILAEKPRFKEGNYVVKLLGIPVKRVSVHVRETVYVMPGGCSVGVSMYTKGVLIVGLGSIDTAEGRVSPAAAAGLRAGDVLISIDGVEVEGAAHMAELCGAHEGSALTATVLRGGETLTFSVTPAVDLTDGVRRIGMWVRESTAGIGTLSFYVMSSLRYGALGHAVTDADTGERLLVKSGEIIRASIIGVALGEQGAPGEIRGTFNVLSKRLGNIEDNTVYGVFGTLYEPLPNPLYPEGVQLAYPDELEEGPAQILTSVDAEGVKAYDCEIIKLYAQDAADTKGMVIRVTDPELIEKTGGIVQGMSGSPILQNGKLAGAITHVFINDPLKGYCVYALWMKENCSTR